MLECRFDLKTLHISTALHLLYSWMVDDVITGRGVARQVVRDILRPPPPAPPDLGEWDPATFGLTPEAIASQQRAMSMFGPS